MINTTQHVLPRTPSPSHKASGSAFDFPLIRMRKGDHDRIVRLSQDEGYRVKDPGEKS